MAVTTTALAIGGLVLGAASLYQGKRAADEQESAIKRQGGAQAKLEEQQRKVHLANAAELERQAQFEELIARSEISDIQRMASRLFGSQQAAFAGAGVQLMGTAQDVMLDTLSAVEREVAKVKVEGAEVVRNLRARVEIEKLGGESAGLAATLSRTTAGAAGRAASLAGTAQVLGGAAQLAFQGSRLLIPPPSSKVAAGAT